MGWKESRDLGLKKTTKTYRPSLVTQPMLASTPRRGEDRRRQKTTNRGNKFSPKLAHFGPRLVSVFPFVLSRFLCLEIVAFVSHESLLRVNSPSHGIFSQPMGRLPLAESSPMLEAIATRFETTSTTTDLWPRVFYHLFFCRENSCWPRSGCRCPFACEFKLAFASLKTSNIPFAWFLKE